jgi:hypothetical protein
VFGDLARSKDTGENAPPSTKAVSPNFSPRHNLSVSLAYKASVPLLWLPPTDSNRRHGEQFSRAMLAILLPLLLILSMECLGGTPPYLAPYFAAKAGMDAVAVIYARELTRWDIETSTIVPGAFTGGTNHFAHAGSPDDKARAAEYEGGPYAGFADKVHKGFASIVPPDADISAVAEAIVRVVDAPFGKRPFRVHIDPTQDGAEVVNAVSDRVRAELLRRIGLGDLLSPTWLPA